VAPLVDDRAAPHLAHLVDSVGELVAAVFDMHARPPEGEIAAIDVGNAGHQAAADGRGTMTDG
jgi:hypothetical protein